MSKVTPTPPPALPPGFLEGPWITAEEVMQWFRISKNCLKSWRFRGKIAYAVFAGVIMYNKPWILQQLANGWVLKPPRPRKK